MKRLAILTGLILVSLLVGIVDADPAPVAAFSANVTTGCAPLHIAFTDESTRSPTNWDWYWWANETKGSDLQNPTAIFPAGTYNVRLYVNTATHGDWENKTGYIATTAAPVAAFSGTPTSGTAPLSVQFNDTSSNSPDNWDWYWFANETKGSDVRNATNSFAAGTYNVRLYVSNCGGAGSDWENKTGYITSNVPPADPFNVAHYGNWTDFVVNSTTALTNYQVKMILDNRTGSSTTTLFYTNGTTRSDWADVAWTDTSNATLGFWNETNSDTATNTTWWIKVPSIANDNTTKIRLFYGNASKTTSYADGYNTFMLFDDFPGTSINTTTWYVGSYVPEKETVANGMLNLSGGKVAATIRPGFVSSKASFSAPYQMISRTYYLNAWSATGSQIPFGSHNHISATNDLVGNNPTTYGYRMTISDTAMLGANLQEWSGSWTTHGQTAYSLTNKTWYKNIATLLPSGTNNIKEQTYSDSYSLLVTAQGSDTSYTSGYVALVNYVDNSTLPNGNQGYYDWVFIKNMTATEPFLSLNITGGAAPPSPPVASFTVNRDPARIPQSITVTDTSTNTPTSWAWSWGDGTANSTTQNPTHEYTKRGRWNIILTATNAGGSGTNSANYVRVVGYENYY